MLLTIYGHSPYIWPILVSQMPVSTCSDSIYEHVHTKWGQKCDIMSKIENALINYICVLGFSEQMEVSMPGVSGILNDNISKYSVKMTHCQVCHLDTKFTQKWHYFSKRRHYCPKMTWFQLCYLSSCRWPYFFLVLM